MIYHLLSSGADVNYTTSDGTTPLMTAISNGNMKVARELLKRGADPSVRDNHGTTLIQLALKQHVVDWEFVKLLRDASAVLD